MSVRPPPWLAPATATRVGVDQRVGPGRLDRPDRVGDHPPVVVRPRVEHAAGHEARVLRRCRRPARGPGCRPAASRCPGPGCRGTGGRSRPRRRAAGRAAARGRRRSRGTRPRTAPARSIAGRDGEPRLDPVAAVPGEADVVGVHNGQSIVDLRELGAPAAAVRTSASVVAQNSSKSSGSTRSGRYSRSCASDHSTRGMPGPPQSSHTYGQRRA